MARQWLQFYQRGPSWVLPTVLCGTASNAALAALRHAGSGPASSFFLFRSAAAPVYAAAAAAILAIMPLTMLYFEPGINGACKWKIETVLRDEGFNMPEKRAGRPSPLRQSGTMQSRRYAETRTLQELLWEWERINHVRWVIGLAAAMASGWATLCL